MNNTQDFTSLTHAEKDALIAKLYALRRELGFTSALINRGGALLCTIDEQEGDFVLCRLAGKRGIFTP